MAKIPQGRVPPVEISSEDLKAISAITGMLADKPEVLKKIADRMEALSEEYTKKMNTEISDIMATAVKLDPDKIAQLQPIWAHIWHPWQIWYWDHTWYQPWTIWGPYVDPRQIATDIGRRTAAEKTK